MPVRLSVYLLPEQWAIVSEVLNARSDYVLGNQFNDDAIEEITKAINAVIAFRSDQTRR